VRVPLRNPAFFTASSLAFVAVLAGCQERERAVSKSAEPAAAQPFSPDHANKTVIRSEPKARMSSDIGLPDDEARLIAALDGETRRIAAAVCRQGEEAIFHCKIKNGKPLSVCATRQGEGEYRYGGDNLELVLQHGSWSADTSWARGGESQIRFVNGDTSYIVFSRMVATSVEENGSGPAISDGVVIERKGQPGRLRLCEGKQADIPVNYSAAKRVFGEPDDLYTGQTAEADTIE
jgi:hypothetical protein